MGEIKWHITTYSEGTRPIGDFERHIENMNTVENVSSTETDEDRLRWAKEALGAGDAQ